MAKPIVTTAEDGFRSAQPILQEYYYRNTTTEIPLQKYYYRNTITEILLQKYYYRNTTGILLGDIAAVDDELGAGDERGFVGGEEQHPVGDLDRLADAAQRCGGDLVGA